MNICVNPESYPSNRSEEFLFPSKTQNLSNIGIQVPNLELTSKSLDSFNRNISPISSLDSTKFVIEKINPFFSGYKGQYELDLESVRSGETEPELFDTDSFLSFETESENFDADSFLSTESDSEVFDTKSFLSSETESEHFDTDGPLSSNTNIEAFEVNHFLTGNIQSKIFNTACITTRKKFLSDLETAIIKAYDDFDKERINSYRKVLEELEDGDLKDYASFFLKSLIIKNYSMITARLENSNTQVKDLSKIAEAANEYRQEFKFDELLIKVVARFYSGSTDERREFLNSLINSGYKVSESSLEIAIALRDYSLMKQLLQKVDQKVLTENSQLIFSRLIETNDVKMFDIVVENVPKMGQYIDLKQLKSSILSGSISLALKFLESLTKESRREALIEFKDLALNTYNLSLIRYFYENLSKLEKTEISYLSFLEIHEKLTNDELEFQLTKYGMHSPLEDFCATCKGNNNLEKLKGKILEKIALMVRFPNLYIKEIQKAVKHPKKDASKDAYEKNSYEYASNNLAFITKEASNLPLLTWEKMLEKIVKHRAQTTSLSDNSYLKQRTTDQNSCTITTVLHLEKKLLAHPSIHNSGVPYYSGLATSRYANSLLHLDTTAFEGHRSKSGAINSYYQGLLITQNTMNFLPIFQPGINWIHNNSSVDKFKSLFQELHQKIVDFDLKNRVIEELDALIAEGYWLQANMSEMMRGTPHNAMIWLNLVTNHHKMAPIIPKKEHFFLDNTALMVPVEIFVKKWRTYIEDISI